MYFKILVFITFMRFSIASDTGLSDDHKTKLSDHFVQYGVSCITQHQISFEDLQALKAMELPKDEKSYCFFACVLRKSELMDRNGRISADAVLKFTKNIFDDEKERREVIMVFLACDHVNDVEVKSYCQRAKLALTCLINSTDAGGGPNVGKKIVQGSLQRSLARVFRSLLLLGCDSLIGDTFTGKIISKFLPGSKGIGFFCSFLDGY